MEKDGLCKVVRKMSPCRMSAEASSKPSPTKMGSIYSINLFVTLVTVLAQHFAEEKALTTLLHKSIHSILKSTWKVSESSIAFLDIKVIISCKMSTDLQMLFTTLVSSPRTCQKNLFLSLDSH